MHKNSFNTDDCEIWFTFSEQNSKITTIFMCYFFIVDNLLFTQLNGIIITIMIYVSLMLQILQRKIKNRNNISNKGSLQKYNILTENQSKKFIAACIQEHLEIIK